MAPGLLGYLQTKKREKEERKKLEDLCHSYFAVDHTISHPEEREVDNLET